MPPVWPDRERPGAAPVRRGNAETCAAAVVPARILADRRRGVMVPHASLLRMSPMSEPNDTADHDALIARVGWWRQRGRTRHDAGRPVRLAAALLRGSCGRRALCQPQVVPEPSASIRTRADVCPDRGAQSWSGHPSRTRGVRLSTGDALPWLRPCRSRARRGRAATLAAGAGLGLPPERCGVLALSGEAREVAQTGLSAASHGFREVSSPSFLQGVRGGTRHRLSASRAAGSATRRAETARPRPCAERTCRRLGGTARPFPEYLCSAGRPPRPTGHFRLRRRRCRLPSCRFRQP